VQKGQNVRDSSLCSSHHIIESNYKHISFFPSLSLDDIQSVSCKKGIHTSRQLKKWRTRIRVGLGWWLQGRKCFDDTTQS